MVVIEFKAIGPGKCRWCRKDKDQVITLAFSVKSFVGSYCFADFKKALQDRLEEQTATPRPEPPKAQPAPAKAEPVTQPNGAK
jgi:hypothetical protein